MVMDEDVCIPRSELEPMRTFLTGVLRAKQRGDSEHYDLVCSQRRRGTESTKVARLYAGLQELVPSLVQRPERFRELISAMLSYNGRAGGLGVLKRFQDLAIALVGANSTFFIPAVKALCRSLRLDSSELREEDPDIVSQRSRRFAMVHEAVRRCLELTPSGAGQLVEILTSDFPHRAFAGGILRGYTEQVLQVCKYAPTLQATLLELLMDRCLEIDVEIKINDSGTVAIEEDAETFLDDVLNSAGGTEQGEVPKTCPSEVGAWRPPSTKQPTSWTACSNCFSSSAFTSCMATTRRPRD